MKLLQTLVEAVSTKAQTAANEIVADQAKLASLAKGAAGYLKKQFGEALLDTPLAVIIQHIRSYVDSATSTRLNKDGLEAVTRAVTAQVKPYLEESEEVAGLELSESKMSELDLDLDELSGTEFKKKYKLTKAEMRKKIAESADAAEDDGEELAEAAVEESVLGTPGQEQSVETVFHLILADEIDAYDVLTRPQGSMQRQAAKIIQRMYDSHTEGTGLHGDDDHEQIMLNVYEDIEARYGEKAGQSPFESVQESDDLEEATRGRPRKNPPKEEKVPGKRGRPRKTPAADEKPAKPAAKKADDSDDEDDKKKVSSKALAKSMENDDGEEDADAKKADSAAKDAPKKIADTSVKPDQLNDANKKLSKQIQHAVHTSSVKSAFELSKELRAAFKDITTDEVKQACAIWKSENQ